MKTIKIRSHPDSAGDKVYDLYDGNKILRSILFSREAQEDLNTDKHFEVIDSIEKILNESSKGPNLKIVAENRARFDFDLWL